MNPSRRCWTDASRNKPKPKNAGRGRVSGPFSRSDDFDLVGQRAEIAKAHEFDHRRGGAEIQ
ncbi:MAG: hypothetical protein ACK4LQ_11475, partial [Pararhodobacter sp.]